MTALQVFGIGAFGAFLQEALWWYNARHTLDHERYTKLRNSMWYWAVSALFVLVTGGMVVIWYMGEPPPTPRVLMLTGAAAPLLVKQAMKAFTPPQHFGSRPSFSFRDYLQ